MRMIGDKMTESINKLTYILYCEPYANFWIDFSDRSDKIVFVVRGNDELWNRYNKLIKDRGKYDNIHECLGINDVERYEEIVGNLKKRTNNFKSYIRLLVD